MEKYRFPRKHLLKYLKSKSEIPAVNSIYIHIPFCRRKCPYCDFYSITAKQDLLESYLKAVSAEILQWKDAIDLSRTETVYVGGGTPGLLNPGQLKRLFEAIFSAAGSHIKEITVEANPESLNKERLAALKEIGAIRISLGVQSFNPKTLTFLGRIHTERAAFNAASMIKEYGFDLNLDFIYGVPGEPLASWEKTLSTAVELRPDSVSCYALSVKGKSFRGMPIKSEEKYFEEYMLAVSFLKEHGYQHYEVSNWALPGKECRHNLNYWMRNNYLGIGPAAASLIDSIRFTCKRDLDSFLNSAPLFYFEELNQEQIKMEKIYLGLRTSLGVDVGEIKPELRDQYINLGLLEVEQGRIRTTDRGMFVLDSLVLNLLG